MGKPKFDIVRENGRLKIVGTPSSPSSKKEVEAGKQCPKCSARVKSSWLWCEACDEILE
jgi:hypothetical protein